MNDGRERTHVVTCFLRNSGDVLLLRRSDEVGTYSGRWSGVSGYVESDIDVDVGTEEDGVTETTDEDAWREVEEETGLSDGVSLVRRGEPFEFTDDDLGEIWVVHPYLFDSGTRSVELDWESVEGDWVPPTEILRRETVPRLWTSYERVSPTVETVESDEEHGSAYISRRALGVLRDTAGEVEDEGGDFGEVRDVAERLVDARPSMSSLTNRVNRVMCSSETPEEVERAAHEEVKKSYERDSEAARRAGETVEGKSVLTLSRSGTVIDALTGSDVGSVVVAESRPGHEGAEVAEELSEEGVDVTLIPDAGIPRVVSSNRNSGTRVDVVIVGADTVLPSGGVVNKLGTLSAALAAEHEGVPFYAVASTDKVSYDEDPKGETREADEVHERVDEAGFDVENPVFDVTPPTLVTGVITERGVLETKEVEEIAEEMRGISEW